MRDKIKTPSFGAKINVCDDMEIDIKPSPKVFCAKCRKHVFWLNNLNKNNPKYPIDFIPVNGVDVINSICPFCKSYVFALMGNQKTFKTSEGWRNE